MKKLYFVHKMSAETIEAKFSLMEVKELDDRINDLVKAAKILEQEAQRLRSHELDETKFKALEAILLRDSLGVCTADIFCYRSHPGETEMQRRGIFPLSKLRLYFFGEYYGESYHSRQSTKGVTDLEHYCPFHFPTTPHEKNGLWIRSEVVDNNGRLIIVATGADITDFYIKRLYKREIYEYFNIPPAIRDYRRINYNPRLFGDKNG